MGKYKDFKTYIRKKIGLVGVAEFVNDSVEANTQNTWNSLFSNPKFLKGYNTQGRISSLQELIAFMDKHINLSTTKSIVDVGCGTGLLLRELNKSFPEIQLAGNDFSEESIALCKQVLPTSDFYISDIYKKDASEKKYDVVMCSEVLEHLLYPDKALKNLFYLLKNVTPTHLVLAVPNGRLDTYGGHINFWSPESWNVFINQNIDKERCSVITDLFQNGRNIVSVINVK